MKHIIYLTYAYSSTLTIKLGIFCWIEYNMSSFKQTNEYQRSLNMKKRKKIEAKLKKVFMNEYLFYHILIQQIFR